MGNVLKGFISKVNKTVITLCLFFLQFCFQITGNCQVFKNYSLPPENSYSNNLIVYLKFDETYGYILTLRDTAFSERIQLTKVNNQYDILFSTEYSYSPELIEVHNINDTLILQYLRPRMIEKVAHNVFWIIGAVDSTTLITYPNELTTYSTTQVPFIIEVNDKGEISWAAKYSGLTLGEFAKLIKSRSGEIYITGPSIGCNQTNYDIMLAKFDTNGNIKWLRSIGGSWDDGPNSIIENSNGKIIVAGRSESFGSGNSDGFIVELTPDGNLSWAKKYPLAGIDFILNIIEVSSYYVIYGYGGSEPLSSYLFLARIDKTGKFVNGSYFGDFLTYPVQLKTYNGYYYLLGSTDYTDESNSKLQRDIVLYIVDQNFNLVRGKRFGGGEFNSSNDIGSGLEVTKNGITIYGYTNAFSPTPSGYIINEHPLLLSECTGAPLYLKKSPFIMNQNDVLPAFSTWSVIKNPMPIVSKKKNQIIDEICEYGLDGCHVYPNPGNNFNISCDADILSIVGYDILGKQQFRMAEIGNKNCTLEEPILSNQGVYLLRISTAAGDQVLRVVRN